MDDVWLFGVEESALRSAQYDLQSAAQSVGLNLNSAKTHVYTGRELYEKAREIEHSAVDGALDTSGEQAPLEELVDRLLEEREVASRVSVKFVVLRLLDHNIDYRLQDLAEQSPRMPHCADSLARLFARSFTPDSLEEWFVDQVSGGWWQFDWSISFYLRMFSSGRVPPRRSVIMRRKSLRTEMAISSCWPLRLNV
jgi:hypothetical protein